MYMCYDFHELNDKEFEILVCDLISEENQCCVERFKNGKDQGIDGRFYVKQKTHIIQAKHYLKTGIQGLLQKIKTDELPKVKKLNPQRYILATSVDLSPSDKKSLKQILGVYIKNSTDILGQKELNYLIQKHPDIEEKYYKLWIKSTNVYKRIISNAIAGRSEFKIKQIIEESAMYVETADYNIALKCLEKNHGIIILDGEPGIGKTTLAKNICLQFIQKGYQFINIENSLNEAEQVYVEDKKQIFYYDDFLGSNYFEAIENKKDSHIMDFILRIQKDKNKIFVLTSRTNIFLSGIHHSPIFFSKKIDKNEFLLTINKLSPLDKAKILYNHIRHSNLKPEMIDEIYKEQRYKKIIGHKNFNPRLIEFITDMDRINIDTPQDYRNYVEEKLNNPIDVRSDSFYIQSNEFLRNLVLLVVLNGGKIKEADLKKSYNKINKLEGIVNQSNTDKSFENMSKLAVKYFLNRNKVLDDIYYDLFNPSITDFILNKYKDDYQKLENIYAALDTIESINHLGYLEKSNIILLKEIYKIKEILFRDKISTGIHNDYKIALMYYFLENKKKQQIILKVIKDIMITPTKIEKLYELLEILIYFLLKKTNIDTSNLVKFIQYHQLDDLEIKRLIYFYKQFGEVEDIRDEIEEQVAGYIKLNIENALQDIDLNRIMETNYDEDGNQLLYLNEKLLYGKLNDIVEDMIDEIDANGFLTDTYKNNLMDDIDKQKLEDQYLEELASDYDDDVRKDMYDKQYDNIDDIDDLFQKC